MAIQKIKNRYVGGMSFIALASYRVISTISIRKYIPTGRTGPWRAADRWTIHYPWNITDDHIHVSDSGLWIGFKGKDRIFQSRLIASFPSDLCYDQIIQQYANALARHACWYDHVWCYEYHTVVIFLVLWNMYTHTHTHTHIFVWTWISIQGEKESRTRGAPPAVCAQETFLGRQVYKWCI